MDIQSKSTNQNKLCLSCQKFFGNQKFNWMCSLCFKKSSPKPEQTVKKQMPIQKQEKKQVPLEKQIQQIDKKRCFKCNKKVNLLGIQCKCTFVFCNLHRMPQQHDCKVDYRKIGMQKLAKQNQKVASRKVSQI